MSDTLPGLVVLTIGGSKAPPLLLLTILFLGTRQPLPNAGALALGYFTTCAVIGISGLLLFGGAESTVYPVGRVISATVGTLLIVMGLYASAPQQASEVLGSLRTWMEKNNPTITVVLCLAFGTFFLLRGLMGA